MIEINSVPEFIVTVFSQGDKWKIPPWCRGEPANVQTPLIPSMLRPPHTVKNEFSIYDRFIQLAKTRENNLPGRDEYLAWLFFMQHHGLPTRLLDWTESPLVALFHAVTTDSENDSKIWLLHPGILNEKNTGKFVYPRERHPDVHAIIKLAYGTGKPTEKVCAIIPPETNLRMLLQNGRATIHGTATSIAENADDSFLTALIVPQANKKQIRIQLARLGMTRSVLFPDLDSLAFDLANKVWLD